MTTTELQARDLYLKHTDTNGKTTVQCHRVWDADRFFFARQGDCHKANADVKDGQRLAAVALSSRAEYLATRKTT